MDKVLYTRHHDDHALFLLVMVGVILYISGWIRESEKYLLPNSLPTKKRTLLSSSSRHTSRSSADPLFKEEGSLSSYPDSATAPASAFGRFANDTFFLTGFAADMTAYLTRLITAGGGRKSPVFTERITKALIGSSADVK